VILSRRLGPMWAAARPKEFGAVLHAETVRWTKVIKDAGIKI
jgi:hypothetical protein